MSEIDFWTLPQIFDVVWFLLTLALTCFHHNITSNISFNHSFHTLHISFHNSHVLNRARPNATACYLAAIKFQFFLFTVRGLGSNFLPSQGGGLHFYYIGDSDLILSLVSYICSRGSAEKMTTKFKEICDRYSEILKNTKNIQKVIKFC